MCEMRVESVVVALESTLPVSAPPPTLSVSSDTSYFAPLLHKPLHTYLTKHVLCLYCSLITLATISIST